MSVFYGVPHLLGDSTGADSNVPHPRWRTDTSRFEA